MLPLNDLTRRESQIMEVLYRLGEASVEQIRAELPDPPSPSSVRKLLDILMQREHVCRRYDGPRHIYYPALSAGHAQRSILRQVVRTFFGGSREAAVSALLRLDGSVSEAELQRVLEMLPDDGEGDA